MASNLSRRSRRVAMRGTNEQVFATVLGRIVAEKMWVTVGEVRRGKGGTRCPRSVSYTHLRAHETEADL
eukprot:2022599-Rhodomonas_salina.2